MNRMLTLLMPLSSAVLTPQMQKALTGRFGPINAFLLTNYSLPRASSVADTSRNAKGTCNHCGLPVSLNQKDRTTSCQASDIMCGGGQEI